MSRKKGGNQQSQSERFTETAKQLKCDNNTKQFYKAIESIRRRAGKSEKTTNK